MANVPERPICHLLIGSNQQYGQLSFDASCLPTNRVTANTNILKTCLNFVLYWPTKNGQPYNFPSLLWPDNNYFVIRP